MKVQGDASMRIIIDHKDTEVAKPEAWAESPCWPHGCTLYWDNVPTNHVRIQHGDNPEATREFETVPYRKPAKSKWIYTDDLYAWLAAIHAYEVHADAPPQGRGAE